MVHSQHVKAPIHSLFRHFLRFFSVFAFVYLDFSLLCGRFKISQPCKLFGLNLRSSRSRASRWRGRLSWSANIFVSPKFFQLNFASFFHLKCCPFCRLCREQCSVHARRLSRGYVWERPEVWNVHFWRQGRPTESVFGQRNEMDLRYGFSSGWFSEIPFWVLKLGLF